MESFKLNQEVYFIIGYKIRIGNIHRLVTYIDEDNPNGRITDIIIHEYEENEIDFKSHSLDVYRVFENKTKAEVGLKIKKSSEFINDK